MWHRAPPALKSKKHLICNGRRGVRGGAWDSPGHRELSPAHRGHRPWVTGAAMRTLGWGLGGGCQKAPVLGGWPQVSGALSAVWRCPRWGAVAKQGTAPGSAGGCPRAAGAQTLTGASSPCGARVPVWGQGPCVGLGSLHRALAVPRPLSLGFCPQAPEALPLLPVSSPRRGAPGGRGAPSPRPHVPTSPCPSAFEPLPALHPAGSARIWGWKCLGARVAPLAPSGFHGALSSVGNSVQGELSPGGCPRAWPKGVVGLRAGGTVAAWLSPPDVASPPRSLQLAP